MNGTAKNHPARIKARENEIKNVNPIGEPPDYLSDEACAAWHQIVKESIDGVLGEADRIALEQCSKLYAKSRTEDLTGTEHTQFFRYLGQFGMLPADRAKIQVPQKKPENKFDD